VAFEAVVDTKASSIANIARQSVLDLHRYDEDECMSALPVVVNFTGQRNIPAADLDVRRNIGLIMNKLKKRPEVMSVIQDYYTGFPET